jgi:dTDP-4-dehydrorhamnose reductase
MKKRVLVIGSSGMLGVDLCHELRGSYEVWGADVRPGLFSEKPGHPGPMVQDQGKTEKRFFVCDITDRKSVDAGVRKVKPDVVILTAAWTDVDGCERDPKKAYRVNADGVRTVALACKTAGIPLVYISTDFVFNGKKRSPYSESDTPAPLSVYGDSKLQGEIAIRKKLNRHIIVRTSWLYGAHGKNFVDTIISKGRETALTVVDDQVGSPTFTKDLAAALHALLKVPFTECPVRCIQYGTYHISNAGKVSWYEYAKSILRYAHVKAKVVPISSKELDRPAKRPAMSVLDNQKFRRLTGYKMRGWKDALRDYLRN